jgi:hypothetical protein
MGDDAYSAELWGDIYKLRDVNKLLVAVLADCIDSLEYVNRAHPEATGMAVRVQRIAAAYGAIKAAQDLDS